MKHSIKRQFAIIFIALMAGTIVLCWIINNLFLESFYTTRKIEAIEAVYNNINDAMNSGDLTSDIFEVELRKTCDMYNIEVLVIDSGANVVISVSRGRNILNSLQRNIFDRNRTYRLLQEADNYYLASNMDKMTNTEYLEMWGNLSNGNLFLIMSPLESIRESVEIANKFLAYVGLIATLVSALIILWVTDRITKPIMQLKDISEQMKNLNFENKYVSRGQNEIDLLGEHINQLSASLEHTISELKTANNELQKDLEKKEQIDEMRKEFLSNVSHELKTPLALIQGYAEGLKEGINQDDAESRDFYCDVIMDEANKMSIMVKKLLDLNQLEFGNDIVALERFDIVELLRNFLQSAEILVQQSDVTLRMEEYPPIYVWADEYKTEEVIRNYFSNAMNHVGGDRIIEIKCTRMGPKVRISIFNTGEPIPEDSLPHIWEKFYKVDKARTREYGGNGVGLSIVKAIMESMNQQYGAVNYTNGVEFWMELETK